MFENLRPQPPVSDLIAGDGALRAIAWRYWLRDTLIGRLNLSMSALLRAVPTEWGSAFAATFAGLTRARFPDSDARARRLWLALRPGEADAVDDAMRRLWRNACRTMAEYSRLHRLREEGRLTVDGLEHIEAARAAGRPVVVTGLHLGNWETLALALVSSGYPLSGTYLPPDNRFDERIATGARLRYGARLVYPDKQGGRAAYRALRAGDLFLFYIDELFDGRVSAPAFGRERRLSGNIANAVRLARLADAVIIPMYAVRIDDSPRFRVTVLPPVELQRTVDSRADLAANIARLDGVIDPVIRRHLDQWFYALDFEFD